MSQAVSTFGIGSIYEMRTSSSGASMILHSVMVAGLDFWPNDQASIIREPSLERALRVDYFRRPPLEESTGGSSRNIPAVRFPGVYYCDKCGKVGRVGHQFSDIGFGGVRCALQNCSGKGVPFRFVVACHDRLDMLQPGHIEDFPYEWWAHRGRPLCSNPSIRLIGSEEKSGLEGMILRCDSCNESHNLAGIFSDHALAGRRCGGFRPWLGDRVSDCPRPLRVLQRGASNVYFPVTASALSIPPFSNRLLQLLAEVVTQGNCQSIKNQTLGAMEVILDGIRNTPGLDDPNIFTDHQIREGLLLLAGVNQHIGAETEAEHKKLERNALVAGQLDETNGELLAIPSELSGAVQLLSGFARELIQVHRLREVRALRGFQRVAPIHDGDPYQVTCAPISRKSPRWLPAIEVRGEGIYLELDPDVVGKWELSEPVENRIGTIRENYLRACKNADRAPGPLPSARLVLAHTLSHMLMKQLSLECGYSGSSLRERLYVYEEASGAKFTGFLIYTASSSADGTLGGLVSQGEPKVFEQIMRSAIGSARWCSSDPLCIESSGQGNDALNLAACHACALIAETSCERRNVFLDRAMVIGTIECPEIGLFSPMMHLLD